VAGDEPVEILDDAGRVVGRTTRSAMRAGNLRHRSVAVVVVTGAGELVVHRRADWKDVWPGRWDVCFGGVVGVGESWEAAAVRELAEEAGVRVDEGALVVLGDGSYADGDVSAVSRVFLVGHDGPFRPADGEVAELVLVPLADVGGWLPGHELCPDAAAIVVPLVLALGRGEVPGGGSGPGG
jgi:8-oxo-dGTP pyrophosphatase MutT (NUDIX family)